MKAVTVADRAAELESALERLDAVLIRAVAVADQTYGAEVASDPFRGLHLSAADVTAGFARRPGAPYLDGPSPGQAGELPQALAWLAASFELSRFDVDVVLVCLAPEIDLRYERVYAYLQDDVTRRQPSVELVLNLFCSSTDDKLAARTRFAPEAPLLRAGLLHLDAPERRAGAPLLAHTLRLDPQIVDVLLGQGGVDRRLARRCQLVQPQEGDGLPADPALVEALGKLVADALHRAGPLRLYFQGPPGAGRTMTALAVAARAGTPVLIADLRGGDPSELPLVFREARLRGALLYLNGVDAVQDDPQDWSRLLEALQRDRGVTVLAGSRSWPPGGRTITGTTSVQFGPLGRDQRRRCWRWALAANGLTLEDGTLELLAARFQLGIGQIQEAAASARATAALRRAGAGARPASSPPVQGPSPDDLFAAARAQSGHELALLSRRVSPSSGWKDLVLPADALTQLHEICARVGSREQVITQWGFGGKGPRGLGTSVLFHGPAGTGKTMAAEIIAGELGLDLFVIDLSTLVSKYVGETEKNLDRLFRAASAANAVLFFDEADALFGKRSEVRDSHDRYANIEISFLLQKMEEFDGVAILATNLRQHLDEAFLRRLAFSVAFPFPDEASRRRIWSVIWPDVPLAEDVDLELLAERFTLSGGNIRNIALASAYLAAADGQVVRMEHLLHAIRREYQKMGKALGTAELELTHSGRSVEVAG